MLMSRYDHGNNLHKGIITERLKKRLLSGYLMSIFYERLVLDNESRWYNYMNNKFAVHVTLLGLMSMKDEHFGFLNSQNSS